MIIRRVLAILIVTMLAATGLQGQVPASAESGSGFSARGIPLQGQVLLGAASGNSAQDPLPREATVGGKFGLHRTYWRGDQQVSAMDRARVDLANGRLPWLSFKAPYAPGTSTPLSWTEMVAGAGDAWARDLAARLGTLPGPVWVAVHHEPEGDGDEQEWKRMQQRLAPIFRAQPNIAFTIILMGYHQWMAPTIDPRVSMDALFPGTQYVDVVGFDPYCWYGTKKSDGSMITTFTELKAYYTKIAAWAASVGGVKWAVAETGYTDLAADKDVAWLSRAYDDMRTAGGIALTYWDNQGFADAVNTFRLSTTAKQAEFAQALARSNRLTDTTTPPTAPSAPATPSGLVGSASGSTAVALSWSASSGATGYTVFRDGVQVGTTQVAASTDTGLTPGTSYAYSVQASNAGGTSAMSSPVTVTTPVAAPANPVAFRVAATSTGNSKKATVTIPAQVQGGDTLILFASTNTGVVPNATAAGWVNAGQRTVKDLSTVMWTRVAGAGDAGSLVTVDLPRTSKYDLTMMAYSGASSARPISALASAPEVISTTQHLTPSVTVPDSASTVLSYWVDKSSATTGWTLPSDQVRRSQNLGAGNGRLTSVAADSGRTTPGGYWAPVTARASASSARATMWTVALTAGA